MSPQRRTPISDMLLSHLENNVQTAPRPSDKIAADQIKPPALSENNIQKVGKNRLIWGGLIFIGLTVGIFWYQFYMIPIDQRPSIWNQLQWRYLFWLLLFLPIETFAAGLRIWVIGRALQPGVSFWTCLKAEWANLGLAMLTPSQTGGGFGQIYMLNRGGMNIGTALTVSLISFLGSMVVLLIIGVHALLIAKIDRLAVFFQGAFLIFLLVFALVIFAVCWPASLGYVISEIFKGIRKIWGEKHSPRSIDSPPDSLIRRLAQQLRHFPEKLIDLCYMHQANMRRFFSQDRTSFVWVCFLSIVFMLARSVMAFLCLGFLGIQASGLWSVIETQLSLIFLIYFAPTPGSSGLAEGASMLLMDGAVRPFICRRSPACFLCCGLFCRMPEEQSAADSLITAVSIRAWFSNHRQPLNEGGPNEKKCHRFSYCSLLPVHLYLSSPGCRRRPPSQAFFLQR